MNKALHVKLTLWLTVSVFLVCLTTLGNWAGFKSNLSYDYIVAEHNVAPWGVLGLCFVWLFMKWKEIRSGMEQGATAVFAGAGIGMAALACFIPVTADFLLLKAITIALGVFAVLFGRGSLLPLIIFSTYAFTILFPRFVNAYLELPYALSMVLPVNWLINALGLPVTASGQVFSFLTPSGKEISVLVSGACAGPATMAVFISIFTLMVLDAPVSRNRAIPLFLLGVLGTWLQNVLRILIILACGYLIGEKALWTAHFYTIYVLFPLWYLLFAAIYFKQYSSFFGKQGKDLE